MSAIEREAADPKMMMVCTECGSRDVMHDAWAVWDEEAQDWVLRETLDAATCEECDGPTYIVAVDYSTGIPLGDNAATASPEALARAAEEAAAGWPD